ncbi:MAG: hypothetical protein ACYC4B_06050 [Pirellulaceae bacterium]
MEDQEDFGSGVVSVFNAIASQRKGEKKPGDADLSEPVTKTGVPNAQQPTVRNQEKLRSRPTARIGRFPGSKNGMPKEKITGRIAPELKDAYVDWALDDRCPLSDLMERALTEFYQRHRAALGTKQVDPNVA